MLHFFHIHLGCSLPVPWWRSALSFASEIINKTLPELTEKQTNPTITVLGDQNLLSFHLVLLGPNFHFHTCKALTSEEVASLDPQQLLTLPSIKVLPLLLGKQLSCSWNKLWTTTPTPCEITWCYHNANQGKFSCCCFTRQKKTPGEHERLGSWGLSSRSFPSCQDTRPFICSALTPWAALAENMTGEALYWTMQVPQNSA